MDTLRFKDATQGSLHLVAQFVGIWGQNRCCSLKAADKPEMIVLLPNQEPWRQLACCSYPIWNVTTCGCEQKRTGFTRGMIRKQENWIPKPKELGSFKPPSS